MTLKTTQIWSFFDVWTFHVTPNSVGKQTHDLTVIVSDSKTTQSGGDNRKKFPLGAALQVPQNFSIARCGINVK
jgi:hypothetical protein